MTSATTKAGLTERHIEGMRVFEGGAGAPVMLLHGLGGTAATWVEVAPLLTGSHRVLAPDLPGHGGSAALPRGSSTDAFAARVVHLVEAADAGPAIVAGHSFGGLVALRLAVGRPELVRALLLVAPAGIGTTVRSARVAVVAAGLLRPGRVPARLRGRWGARAWFRRVAFRPWFVADEHALSAPAVDGLLEGQLEHSDTRTAGRAMLSDDPRSALDRVRCPALVLWGARDAQLPLDDAFEYARRLRAQVRVVADCGHLLIVERPDAVLDGVRHLEVLVREAEARG